MLTYFTVNGSTGYTQVIKPGKVNDEKESVVESLRGSRSGLKSKTKVQD